MNGQVAIWCRTFAVAAGSLLLAGFFAAGEAQGESALCMELEASLVEADGAGQLRAYDEAIDEQRQALAHADDQAYRAGCYQGFDGPADSRAACPGLLGTIGRMTANLEQLERRRTQLSIRSRAGGERNRILAALGANGCLGQAPTRRLPPPLAAKIDRQPQLPPVAGEAIGAGPVPPDALRTLCVRSCDGYFFPISPAATPDLLVGDSLACQARCPGTQAELYVQPLDQQDAETMVSLSGRAYGDLPTAFNYRKPGYRPAQDCSCSPAGQNLPAEEDRPVEGAPAGSFSREPDTQAVRTPEPDSRARLPARDSLEAPARPDRKVRVVGPRFLPDQEEAIDLRSRDRPQAR